MSGGSTSVSILQQMSILLPKKPFSRRYAMPNSAANSLVKQNAINVALRTVLWSAASSCTYPELQPTFTTQKFQFILFSFLLPFVLFHSALLFFVLCSLTLDGSCFSLLQCASASNFALSCSHAVRHYRQRQPDITLITEVSIITHIIRCTLIYTLVLISICG